MGRTVPSGQIAEFTSNESGYCSGNIYGTYVHGLFDEKAVVTGMIEAVAKQRGRDIDVSLFTDQKTYKEKQYDALADTLRSCLDMKAIYEMAGISND